MKICVRLFFLSFLCVICAKYNEYISTYLQENIIIYIYINFKFKKKKIFNLE